MRRAATAEAGSTTATVKFFERGRARQEARMREGPYSVHVTGDVEVIMRDGVPLVTDVTVRFVTARLSPVLCRYC
jgi:predicted acyl esterase